MTQPSPEASMSRDARRAAQKTAQVMREILMYARRQQQRQWASQRATDQMTPGNEQTGRDRLAKLAVGWSAANAQRETNPEMAQRWDRVVTAHGIDPQQLYDTVAQREASTGEALNQRNATAEAMNDARGFRQETAEVMNETRRFRQQDLPQAQPQEARPEPASEAQFQALSDDLLGDIIDATPEKMEEAVLLEQAKLMGATMREGQGALNPDELLQAWAKDYPLTSPDVDHATADISLADQARLEPASEKDILVTLAEWEPKGPSDALTSHQADTATNLEAEAPTQALSLGAEADTGVGR